MPEQPSEWATIDIVFDGPPGPEAGRFVEVECPPGTSIQFGEWVKRDDGFWVLRIPHPDSARREWQPIDTAPKDGTRILLYRCAEGMPKFAGEVNITIGATLGCEIAAMTSLGRM